MTSNDSSVQENSKNASENNTRQKKDLIRSNVSRNLSMRNPKINAGNQKNSTVKQFESPNGPADNLTGTNAA